MSLTEKIDALATSIGAAIKSRFVGVERLRVLTQAEYDAIAAPDPDTLYVIRG